jgi:TetR/AcrR family transcriptional repressor of nem operon
MNKAAGRSATTRKKIIESSHVQFRRLGIEGSSLAGIMSAVGLTNGGFYGHFNSKAHLVAESIAAASQELVSHLTEASVNAEPLVAYEAIISSYLCVDHRDEESGCPYAGWGSDLARSNESVRAQAVEGFECVVAFLAMYQKGQASSERRRQAVLAMCTMMGALTMSRIAKGSALSDEVLSLATRNLLESK